MIFGERKSRPTKMDQGVAEAILSCQDDTSFKTVLGGTMCTDDFYEGIIIHVARLLTVQDCCNVFYSMKDNNNYNMITIA